MSINIGVVGAGAFSVFSVDAFLENKDVSVGGVLDKDRSRAKAFADQYGVRVYDSLEELLKDDGIHLVYIATPPHLHYEQAKSALHAGKHVICEKPAALHPDQAEEVYELAEREGLLYVVNLMQRYNPLYQQVRTLIEQDLLGGFLHGFFENYASDERLGPEHWMWDHQVSGGKFIEHGVHFFDMFEGWLGRGDYITSQKVRRPDQERDFYSRVQIIGKYSNGLVNMYHGFDQPGRMDRQELRLLFEKGDVTLYEWVPVRATITAIVTQKEQEQLERIFPGSEIRTVEEYEGEERNCRGNFKEYRVDRKILLEFGKKAKKGDIYKLILRKMISDQVEWIKNPGHKRVITGLNGVNSLRMAYEAEQNARIIR